MDVELRHLQAIVAVADEGHFTRAAQRLGITQPALSQQIRRIEDALGVAIFVRTSRMVALTEPGRLIVDESRRTIAQVERTLELAHRAARGEIRHLAIGFLASATAGALPDAIYALRARYPELRVTLEERPDSEQIAALTDGRLDVGFVRTYDAMGELRMEVISREPFVAVLPEGHALEAKAEIGIKDLADEAFILWSRAMAPAPYDALLSACWREGFNPRVEHEALNAHTTLALVGAGLGISILAKSYQTLNYWRGVAFVPIRDFNTELLMAWRQTNANPMLDEFVEIIRSLRTARTNTVTRRAASKTS